MLAERVVLSAYSNNPLKSISNETKLGHAFQRFAWSNHFLHWLYLYLHFTILFCTLLDRFCIYGTFCTNEFFALTQFKLLPRIKRFFLFLFFFSFPLPSVVCHPQLHKISTPWLSCFIFHTNDDEMWQFIWSGWLYSLGLGLHTIERIVSDLMVVNLRNTIIYFNHSITSFFALLIRHGCLMCRTFVWQTNYPYTGREFLGLNGMWPLSRFR